MEPDFGGYATKANIRCADGRTIAPGAFDHCDGMKVPLVWGHKHGDASAVLGHALLEKRGGDIYAYGFFNGSPQGSSARESVKHGDISHLSIWANGLDEDASGNVFHGDIREVSLVVAGANPGARIDNVIAHGELIDDEAIISFEEPILIHADEESADDMDEDNDEDDEETLQDVVDSMSEKEKNVVYYMVAEAARQARGEAQHSDTQGEHLMHSNVFDSESTKDRELLHELETKVFDTLRTEEGSLKDAFMAHASTYGVKNPELLFPNAKLVGDNPQDLLPMQEWVQDVISSTSHSPFSRIKTVTSDLTAEGLRAGGYITAQQKEDVVYEVANRETTPQTIYIKTKMDRDDILDITDFSVVAWIKANLQRSLREEIARAALIGDGRQPSDNRKIKADKIRPIWTDDDLYAHKVVLNKDTTTSALIDQLRRARRYYRGSGSPTFYTSNGVLCDLLELKDQNGRYIYETRESLCHALNVSKIVEVEPMDTAEREVSGVKRTLVGIIVNLRDYTFGADRGGETNFFEDFDLNVNQQLYLYEARTSGALNRLKSALVIERKQA